MKPYFLKNVPKDGFPVSRMIPSFLTLAAFCAGLTSIRFAMDQHWQPAIIALGLAALFDALDGRMARLLKASSKFGAELDSLSDLAAFGVAPALIIYFWNLSSLGGFGWAAALFYAVCCALRLARFNTAPDDKYFFQGIPAPVGAGYCTLPLMLTLSFGHPLPWLTPWVVTVWVFFVGLTLILPVPVFSIKHLRVSKKWAMVVFAAIAALATLAIGRPIFTIILLLIVYFISIPFSVFYTYKIKKASEKEGLPDEKKKANWD